jgi:branched-chain amino acid aminotransferase
MWLDSVEHKYIEEMSGMNFFCVIDNKLVTPALTDTILDGVTRRSIMEIARAEKIQVEERRISIDEIFGAMKEDRCTEAFVCGTAAVIAPVESFMDKDQSVHKLKEPNGKVSMQLREKLIAVQAGRSDAPEGWLYPIRDLNF